MSTEKTGLIFEASGNVRALQFALDCLSEEGVPPEQVYSLGNIVGHANESGQCIEIAQSLRGLLMAEWEGLLFYEGNAKENYGESIYNIPLNSSSNIRWATASFTLKRLKKLKGQVPNRHELFRTFLREPLTIDSDFVITNYFQIKNYEWNLFDDYDYKVWPYDTPFYKTHQRIIAGMVGPPLAFFKGEGPELIPIKDYEEEEFWTYDPDKIPEDTWIEWDEHKDLRALTLGGVGYNKYISRGLLQFAILDEKGIKYCFRKFDFDPSIYDSSAMAYWF